MDFILDNYVWFIIGIIVLLMAIVGYIADVTDFGRKSFSKKTKETKEKPKEDKVEEVKDTLANVDTVVNNELPVDNTEVTEVPADVPEPINEVETTENNDFESAELSTDTSDLFTPMEPAAELPEAEIKNDFADELVDDNGTVDQSLFEPLPSIDDTATETTETPEKTGTEEDVWKF